VQCKFFIVIANKSSPEYCETVVRDSEGFTRNDEGYSIASNRFAFIDPVTREPRVFFHGTRDAFTEFDVAHPNNKDAGWPQLTLRRTNPLPSRSLPTQKKIAKTNDHPYIDHCADLIQFSLRALYKCG